MPTSPFPLISGLMLSACAGLSAYDQLGETNDCDPAITPGCGLETTGLPTGTATGMTPGDEVCDDGADNNGDGLLGVQGRPNRGQVRRLQMRLSQVGARP